MGIVAAKQSWVHSLGLAALIGGLCVGTPWASAQEAAQITRLQLSNGLRVVLSPDAHSGNVSVVVTYDVGGRNERPGQAGLAHLAEHLMFRNGVGMAPGDHARLVDRHGGITDGMTEWDRTTYFERLPSHELELGLFLESARMRALAITQTELDAERNTVLDERKQRVDNRVYGATHLHVNDVVYGDCFAYAHAAIGETADLANVSLQDVHAFWSAYYAPNNAVLVIAGDFDLQNALDKVHAYFDAIPARETIAFDEAQCTLPTPARVETMTDARAQQPAFYVAYRVAPMGHADHRANELLVRLLSDGEASRLRRALVQSNTLQELYVNMLHRRGTDLLTIWGVTATGSTSESAREAIEREVADIAAHGVSEREMTRVKNRLRAERSFEREMAFVRAEALANAELYFHDATEALTELDAYDAITSDDLRRAAAQHLNAERRYVLEVRPTP